MIVLYHTSWLKPISVRGVGDMEGVTERVWAGQVKASPGGSLQRVKAGRPQVLIFLRNC